MTRCRLLQKKCWRAKDCTHQPDTSWEWALLTGTNQRVLVSSRRKGEEPWQKHWDAFVCLHSETPVRTVWCKDAFLPNLDSAITFYLSHSAISLCCRIFTKAWEALHLLFVYPPLQSQGFIISRGQFKEQNSGRWWWSTSVQLHKSSWDGTTLKKNQPNKNVACNMGIAQYSSFSSWQTGADSK